MGWLCNILPIFHTRMSDHSGIRSVVSVLRSYHKTALFGRGILHGAIICIAGNIYSISIYLQISMRQSQMSDCKQIYLMSIKITNLQLHLILNQAIQACVNRGTEHWHSHEAISLPPVLLKPSQVVLVLARTELFSQ